MKSSSASHPTRHIPATVWGHTMDYLPYNEVRSALRICKSIAKEAVRHVQTVSFTEACQLDSAALRRFPNITEVKCVCFFNKSSSSLTLCEDTAFRIVPLLTTLPRLERFFLGGMHNGQVRTDYKPVADDSPKRHHVIARTLLYNFIGAFKGRSFSSTLERTNLCDVLATLLPPKSYDPLRSQVQGQHM